MAHFAEIDSNNIVLRVVVVADEFEADGESWCANLWGGTWKQTSYNTYANTHPGNKPFRKNYAGPGFTYDSSKDAFIPPKPYPSWSLDEATCIWKAPVDFPNDGKPYSWNEEDSKWEELK